MQNTKLRSKEMWSKYQNSPKQSGCFLCEASRVRDYEYWYITPNNFPYDNVSEKQDMLVIKRHVGRLSDLTVAESIELSDITRELDYDTIMLNFPDAQSVKGHLHFHLVKWIRA